MSSQSKSLMKPLMLCIILCPVICCATKKRPSSRKTLQFIKSHQMQGAKKGPIYNLPSKQAVASMNQPKSNFNQLAKNFLMRTDYGCSLIIYLNSPKNYTCSLQQVNKEQNSPAQQQNLLAPGYRRLLSLQAGH